MNLQTQAFLESLLAKLVYYKLTVKDLLEFEKAKQSEPIIQPEPEIEKPHKKSKK